MKAKAADAHVFMNEPHEIAITLVTLGALLLLGLVTDAIGRRTRIPRVTLLLAFGIVIGPSCLDLLPPKSKDWFPFVADIALAIVGFLLGEKFKLSSISQHGRAVMWMSGAVVVVTVAIVLVGMLFPVSIVLALMFAGIATATDPAATTDVIRETKAKGKFTDTLLGIVAVDDAWGLIAFSLLLSIALALSGNTDGEMPVFVAIREIGGAVIVGVLVGLPMAYLADRIQRTEPTLIEVLGGIFLCAGISLWLEVSFLMAAMVAGIMVANVARHPRRPFHSIEGVEWPFMILFFALAGASLDLSSFNRIGLIGLAYIVLRICGRVIGAWVGAMASGAGPVMQRWSTLR